MMEKRGVVAGEYGDERDWDKNAADPGVGSDTVSKLAEAVASQIPKKDRVIVAGITRADVTDAIKAIQRT